MERQVDYGVIVIVIATVFAWGCRDLAEDGTTQVDFVVSTKSSANGCVITMSGRARCLTRRHQ